MATHLSLGIDFGTAAMLRTYQVAGLAFIFIPSNVLCYVGIPREKNNQVSSMMNFVRNIGGSVGIALVSTYGDANHPAAAELSLGEHAEWESDFRAMVDGMTATLRSQGVNAAHGHSARRTGAMQ